MVAQARERLELRITRGLLADGCYFELISSGRRPRPVPSLGLDQIPQPRLDKVHAVIETKFIITLDVVQPDRVPLRHEFFEKVFAVNWKADTFLAGHRSHVTTAK